MCEIYLNMHLNICEVCVSIHLWKYIMCRCPPLGVLHSASCSWLLRHDTRIDTIRSEESMLINDADENLMKCLKELAKHFMCKCNATLGHEKVRESTKTMGKNELRYPASIANNRLSDTERHQSILSKYRGPSR